MEAYSGFAMVYDDLMADVDYEKWSENIQALFHRYGERPKRLLELACGTGNLSLRLAESGYDITGLDLSEDMLIEAQEKTMEWSSRARFLQMDMRDISIRDTFDAAVSVCDGYNYLLTDADLRQSFESVAARLNPGGLLIFDISSQYKLEEVIGGRTIAESLEDMAFVWENFYTPETRTLEFDLTVFIQDEESGLFERHQESHVQRAHLPHEVVDAMTPWFDCLDILDAETLDQVTDTSERIYFVARKKA